MSDDDNIQTTEEHVYAPVTVTIDVERLIKSSGFGAPEYDDDYDSPVPGSQRLATLIANTVAIKLAPQVKEAVTASVKEAALAKVDDLLEEVISGPIQLTNTYGERTGSSTTLREQIIKSINDQLIRKVDDQGRTPSYSREGKPYIQYVADEAAKRAINGELKTSIAEAVVDAKARIKTAVTDELATNIARAAVRP